MPLKNVELVSFHPSCIEVSDRDRALNTASVDTLMGSISKIGLRSPITVRMVRKTENGVDKVVPVLGAGLHRLEAVKRLRFESIECLIESGSELDAQLWEIGAQYAGNKPRRAPAARTR